MPEFAGTPVGQGRRIAVVVSRFNEAITQCLVDGAMDALTRHGVAYEDIDVVWVPGAWELPAAARALLASERYHAIVALGAVIRGDTPHFEYVCDAVTAGVGDAMRAHKLPIGFGVLTTNDVQQAMDRAGTKDSNKGYEALLTVIEMIHVIRQL